MAQKFRVGRAILAGDSAHVNSPIGAMGMNSGIHDAINLADKLIAIARGEADEARLAGGARRCMDADSLPHRHRRVPAERRVLLLGDA